MLRPSRNSFVLAISSQKWMSTLLEGEGGWPPYFSLDDAYKLDDVRDALSVGDLKRASQLASHVYRLIPVEA